MGAVFSNLTRHGVDTPSGSQFYGSPGEAAIAAARQTQAPTTVLENRNLLPQAGADSSPQFTPTTSGEVTPRLFRPSFGEAATDRYGEIAPMNPGLNTKGRLLAGLLLAARGVGDGIANGALDAPRRGESSFGRGFQGAYLAPQQRRDQSIARERAELQNEVARQEAADAGPALLFRKRKREADLAQTTASTDAAKAEAEYQRGLLNVREKTVADRIAEARAANLNPDTPQYNKVVFGDPLRPPAKPQPTAASLALAAAGGNEAKALELLTQQAIRRAVASRSPKEQEGGITPAQQRVLNSDAKVLTLKTQLRGLLKAQSDPLNLDDDLDSKIEQAQQALSERTAEVLSGITKRGAKPAAGKGKLSKEEAAGYVDRAGGDVDKARQMATADGRTF